MREDSGRYIIIAVANPLQRVPGRAGTSLSSYGAPPRYTTGIQAARLVEAIARDYGLREAAAWPIPTLNVHCIVFEIDGHRPRDDVIAALSKDSRVALAQPLQDFSMQAAPPSPAPSAGVSYNDPYAPLQRGFIDMAAAQAHRITAGKGAHIAVIDTGAQTEHPDLQGRATAIYNLVDEDARAFQKDRHGTEVLGIMAAAGNNQQGIVGMAPEARFSIYKACWYPAAPPSAGARCNSFTLAKALVAVMASDARIINMSLGGPGDPLLGQLLGQLIAQGRIVVAALPATGQRTGFPASIPGVITVESSGASRASGADGVLMAPGKDVLTLQPLGRYDFASGSSMAAAHVSGMVALLQSAAPDLDRDAVERLLLRSESSEDKGPFMVNAERALATLPSSNHRLAER
ncbi:S8 family serine peptidase [Paracidovorax konjaci]|uniref:Subtilase family protein n=1 Tax=Paracidovorax konjaci TaxID=32040 RepID=A0A1I1SYN3_9BURK|nr:S8 family serine peptidase [Paracidovorax konjaci]SFD51565.1 Subtilase family protein [Paracidovorax konjaci]